MRLLYRILLILGYIASCFNLAYSQSISLDSNSSELRVIITQEPVYGWLPLQADSIILSWSCESWEYHENRNLIHQVVNVGDTLYFPKDNLWVGHLTLFFNDQLATLVPNWDWQHVNGKIRLKTTGILYNPNTDPETTSLEFQNPSMTNFSSILRYDGYKCRLSIYSNSSQVFSQWYYGVEQTNNTIAITKMLAPGWHTIVLKNYYSMNCVPYTIRTYKVLVQ